MRSLLLLSSVLGIGAVAISSAHASGFAVKVNSTELQGRANAGSGVSSDPLAMYNNPAILSQIGAKGGRFEAALSGTGLFPSVKYTDSVLTPGTRNAALNKFTGGAAFAAKINQWVSAGLAVTTPYGLAFDYKRDSIVKNYVVEADLKTVAISPSLAIKFNPMITLGVGIDAQWTDVKFSSFPAAALANTFGTAKGNDWHYRGTFGVLIEPTKDIRFGASIKTRTKAKLSGDYKVENPVVVAPLGINLVDGKASAELILPTTITLSGSYDVTSNWTLYADYVRTNWSSISALTLKTPAGDSTIVGGWEDSNCFSIGTDYKLTDRFTIRGGLGFDYTPTRADNQNGVPSRVPGIPDSNKTWVALGGSYEVNAWKFSLSYGHEFFKTADIRQAAQTNPINGALIKPALNGQVKEHVDLVSFQINYRF